MKFTSFLSLLVGLIGVLWLGIAGFAGAEWYEHRAHGEPTWANVHFLFFHWSPPDSLAAQRDAALAQVKILTQNQRNLEASIADQNRMITDLSAQGAQARALAEKASHDQAQALETAQALSQRLQGLKIQPGTCAPLDEPDRQFVAYLQATPPDVTYTEAKP